MFRLMDRFVPKTGKQYTVHTYGIKISFPAFGPKPSLQQYFHTQQQGKWGIKSLISPVLNL